MLRRSERIREIMIDKPMSSTSFDLRSAQRWCLIASIAAAAVLIWTNTVESDLAKQPAFVLGAGLTAALYAAEGLLLGRMTTALSFAHILVALHLPLFIASAIVTYDPVYTPAALAFGVSCVVFFFAGASAFSTRREIDLLFTCLELLTLLLCLVGLIQFLAGEALPVNFHIGSFGRVSSLLGRSIIFSAYLIVVFPLILARAIVRRRQGTNLLRYMLLAAMVVLLFATRTRSSIGGWMVSIAVLLLFAPTGRRAKTAAAIAGIVTVAAVVFVAVVQPELGRKIAASLDSGRGETLARRTFFWNAGTNAFAASPIAGHGIGSFERAAFEYRSPDYWEARSEDIVPHAHNEVIEIAVEYGALGLLLFIATVIVMVSRVVLVSRSAEKWQGWTGAGILAALAAIGVDNLANVSLRAAPVAAVVWLMMGALWSPAFGPEAGGVTQKPTRPAPLMHRRWRFTITMPASSAAVIIPLMAWLVCAALYVKNLSREIDSSTHLLKGLEYATRNAQMSAAECEAAVASDPLNLLARSYLSQAYANAGRWDDAIRSADALQRFSPPYPKSSLVKAYALLHRGAYRDALQNIATELQRRSHPEAYLIQASAYRALRNEQEERSALLHALRKIVESHQPFDCRAACERLVVVSMTESEKKELEGLIASLKSIDPQGTEFYERELQMLRTGGAH